MQDTCQVGGCIGSVWIDETPRLDQSRIRPFIVSMLLFRGAVRPEEIVHMLSAVCNREDLIEGAWDPFDQDYSEGSRLEKLVLESLGEMTSRGILRYNDSRGIWVLTGSDISQIIYWCAALSARLPHHLIQSTIKNEKRN